MTQRSSTWEAVRSARVDTRDAADPSAAYAEHLRGVLKSAGVAHKVVTYEFHYRTRLREEAIGSRTAVIYRDGDSASNPWWLMDDRLRQPVWLPGENVENQIEYYIHRPATITSVEGSKGRGSEGKMIASARTEEERPSFWARLFPNRQNEAPRLQVRAKGAPITTVTAATAEAPVDGHITPRALALFRARHGTEFDPASVTDRVKMEHLLQVHRQFVERWEHPAHAHDAAAAKKRRG